MPSSALGISGTSAAVLLPQPAWSCGHVVGHPASELGWPGSFEASIHFDMLLGISGWLVLRLCRGSSATAAGLFRTVTWVLQKPLGVMCLQTESDCTGHVLHMWHVLLLTVSCMRLDRPPGSRRCHTRGRRIAARRMPSHETPRQRALLLSGRSPPPPSSEHVHDRSAVRPIRINPASCRVRCLK